jgi:4-amino-4-deoxy-L-arabinose transferase-like glycosyltransferase
MGVEKTRGNGSGFVGQLSTRSYIFLLVALAVAVMARILFLWRGPLLGSDSLSYYGVAKAVVSNAPQEADVFWHNLFCYWEAIVIFFGASYYTAVALASFIPGVLLIIPIFLMSHRLFGQGFAFVAALAAAVHPRLVEYSVNGSIETTYSLCALLGLWGLTSVLGGANGVVWRTAVSGAGLAAYMLIRNEGLLLFGALFLLVLLYAIKARRVSAVLGMAGGAAVVLLAYFGANLAIFHTAGIGQKGSLFLFAQEQRLKSTDFDLHQAARQAYESGVSPERLSQEPELPLGQVVWRTVMRYPWYFALSLKDIAKLLMSPIPLFAPFALLICRRNGTMRACWPSFIACAFPVFFYAVYWPEPRYYFLTLLTVLAFGAAGLLFCLDWLAGRLRWKTLFPLGVSLVLISHAIVIYPLAAYQGRKSAHFRDVAAWIKANIPPDVRITGCRRGCSKVTAFWAHREISYRMWTPDPDELVKYCKDTRQPVLVLFEEYLRLANPELLPALDEGLPGMKLLKAFKFPPPGGRVNIYALEDAVPQLEAPPSPS